MSISIGYISSLIPCEVLSYSLNIFAHSEAIFFGVLNQKNELAFKKSYDFEDFKSIKEIYEALKDDAKKSIQKLTISKAQFVQGPKENLELIEEIKGVFPQLATIDFSKALKACYDSLENQNGNNHLILYLDDQIAFGELTKESIEVTILSELMHTSVDSLGRECECGQMGCLIQYIAPKGLLQTAREKVEFYSGPTQLTQEIPGQIRFKKLVHFTKKGDPLAIEILNQSGQLFLPEMLKQMEGRNVDKVIIAGRLGQFGKLISKPLQNKLQELYGKTTPVLTPYSKSYEEIIVSTNY